MQRDLRILRKAAFYLKSHWWAFVLCAIFSILLCLRHHRSQADLYETSAQVLIDTTRRPFYEAIVAQSAHIPRNIRRANLVQLLKGYGIMSRVRDTLSTFSKQQGQPPYLAGFMQGNDVMSAEKFTHQPFVELYPLMESDVYIIKCVAHHPEAVKVLCDIYLRVLPRYLLEQTLKTLVQEVQLLIASGVKAAPHRANSLEVMSRIRKLADSQAIDLHWGKDTPESTPLIPLDAVRTPIADRLYSELEQWERELAAHNPGFFYVKLPLSRPTSLVTERFTRVFMGSLSMFIAFSILVMVGLFYYSPVVLELRDVENLSDLALGKVPKMKNPKDVLSEFLNYEWEHLRAINRSLLSQDSATAGSAGRVMTLTSPRSSEGNTVAVGFLSMLCHKYFKRILVIDLSPFSDLSDKPNLKSLLGFTLINGELTNSLGMKYLSLEGDLETGVELQELRMHHDLILVDAPALQHSNSALRWAELSDRIILNVKRGGSRISEIEKSIALLSSFGRHRLGLVLNFDPTPFRERIRVQLSWIYSLIHCNFN